MLSTRLSLSLVAIAGLALSMPKSLEASANQASPRGDRSSTCDASAPPGGANGCFHISSINLGPMPEQLYWHIDSFPDVASAEGARTLYGRVTVALGGQVFLQTINDNPSWTPGGGDRLATVGPLQVRGGADLIGRFMEMTIPAGRTGSLPTASGPQAVVLLGGSLCVEMPLDVRDIVSREALILNAGVPSAGLAREPVQALALVIHGASSGWTGSSPDWSPTGLCRL